MTKNITFNSYISQVAPWIPVDNEDLLKKPSPKLIYQGRAVKCDILGTTKDNTPLEKIFSKMLNDLKSYDIKSISSPEDLQLESLQELVLRQYQDYKKENKGLTGKIRLLWRGLFNGGDIDTLSVRLLNKIGQMKALPQPNLPDDEIKAKMEKNRSHLIQEFKTTESLFRKRTKWAINNLDVLIQLSQNPEIESSERLFRAKGKHSLEACKKCYKNLYERSLVIEQMLKIALQENTPEKQSEALARIYQTKDFHFYVKANARCASYHEILGSLVKNLIEKNTFSEDIEQFLENKLKVQDNSKGIADYKLTGTMKLSLLVQDTTFLAVQRVMRHDSLMKEFLKNTPRDAAEYNSILVGSIEANRHAIDMDLRKKTLS